METKNEFSFNGSAFNGFLMLAVNLIVLLLSAVLVIYGILVEPIIILAGLFLFIGIAHDDHG